MPSLAAAVRVGRLTVDKVGAGSIAGAGFALVLTPEQELDGVPAEGDVLFTTALVPFGHQLLGDNEGAVVDQAATLRTLHAVDIPSPTRKDR